MPQETDLISLKIFLPVQVFGQGAPEDREQAGLLAAKTDGVIYTWHTSGLSNWLTRGISRVDNLGLVVLPKGLPDYIDMADDEPEPGDEE